MTSPLPQFTPQRWHALFAHLRPQHIPPFHPLADCYQQPHRVYHTDRHINDCLAIFDQFQSQHPLPALEAAVVELALWFHDSYYDPRETSGAQTNQPDNEAMSADYAATVLQQAALPNPQPIIAAVCDCILATRHRVPPTTPLAALTMDVDLAILGAERDRYHQYTQQIRAEYPWLSDADFRTGRRNFLASLLQRPQLFYTDWFQHRFEAAARRNLVQEAASYSSDMNSIDISV